MKPSQAPDPRPVDASGGFALVLSLIFAILLYVLIAELVMSAKMVRMTGENDALLARMRNHQEYTLAQIEQTLADDLAAAAAQGEGEGEGGAGANPLAGGNPAGGTGEGGAEEEAPPDPAATCDGSRDAWFEPVGHSDGEMTTYVFVEDENRKFNILTLWSPDEEFRKKSRERLVRLIDVLRDDTEFDVSNNDAEQIVRELEEFATRSGSDQMPKPPLKTELPDNRDLALPCHLDDLLLLPTVKSEMFFDKVFDGRVLPGLESVLTVWTSLRLDPGDPEKVARQRQEEGNGSAGAPAPGSGDGAQNPPANDPNAPPPAPEGLGIKLNINTAPRAVLRALFSRDQVPDSLIDAILEYRNEVDEEAMEAEQTADTSSYGDILLGADTKKKVFDELTKLEELPEFAELPDPQLKAEFLSLLTTKADVFSVHMTTTFPRNREQRQFVMRRTRTVMLRIEDENGEPAAFPLILMEDRNGMRVMPVDLQDESIELGALYDAMDSFAQEERAFNPFLRDFYLPDWQREQFYLKKR